MEKGTLFTVEWQLESSVDANTSGWKFDEQQTCVAAK